ncbi:MAG: FAD-binding oxidoreductase [Deltaproteobacteria bacterium]|nr:FAD-binding oxidoreductase [Deltaproteobacteria bacterium]
MKTLAFASGTLFVAGSGAYFVFKNPKTADELRAELSRALEGKVVEDKVLLKEYNYDFGRTLHSEPRVVVHAKSTEDIAKTLMIARKWEVPVTVRGSAHSCYGQTLSDGGILMINEREDPGFELVEGQMSVDSRTKWLALEKAINKKGRTCPVLTDYLDMTVGGTLSVGGYGLSSLHHGSQGDNIEEISLVLPSGEMVHCSEKENSDLFQYSLGGLGQVGVIDKVRFKTRKYKQFSRVIYIDSHSVNEFIHDLETFVESKLSSEYDHFSAYYYGDKFTIEIAKSYRQREDADGDTWTRQIETMKSKGVAARTMKDYHIRIHHTRKSWVNLYGKVHRLWDDYILNADAYKEFLKRTLGARNETKIAPPASYILAINNEKKKRFCMTPDFGQKGKMLYGIGFYHMVRIGDKAQLEAVKTQLEKNTRLCIDLGGRPYLYGWHCLNEEQKKALYSDSYSKIAALKKNKDPGNILNPGVLVNG